MALDLEETEKLAPQSEARGTGGPTIHSLTFLSSAPRSTAIARRMHHNGDDAGAPDRALREFERRPKIAASNTWGVSDVSSRATTTVTAVSVPKWFGRVRLLPPYFWYGDPESYSLSPELWKWRSPRAYRCEYQFDLELTCPVSAQLATACRLRLRRIHRH